jgi:cytoskeletal protein CcmA (bactofilin family)
MLVKGNIQSKQDLFVDGQVDGMLDAPDCRVVIGPHGKASAGAHAREVEVQSGGALLGEVRTGGIVIEDGAFFKGRLDIVRNNGDAERQSD